VWPRVLGEARLIEDNLRLPAIFMQLEADDRIDTFGPSHGAPGLRDSFARNQLDVAANDVPAEAGKAPACGRVDFGWSACRKCANCFASVRASKIFFALVLIVAS